MGALFTPVSLTSTTLIKDANLVSFHKLEDNTDSIGAFTLTDNVAPTYTAGKFANAATYNGSTQGQHIGGASPLGIAGDVDMAFSYWVNITTQPSSAYVLMAVFANSVHGFNLRYDDTGGTKSLILTDGNTMAVTYNYTLTTSTFFNICNSYNSTSKVWTVWVNATTLGTGTSSAPAPGGNQMGYGYDAVNGGHNMTGQVDEGSWFTRQFTQADVNLINGISYVPYSFKSGHSTKPRPFAPGIAR